MNDEMIKFPSIAAPRQVLPSVVLAAQFTHVDPEAQTPQFDKSAPLPILSFRGTIKLHGSNAAIVQILHSGAPVEKSTYLQSRQRILSPEHDLMGFCAHMSGNAKTITRLFRTVRKFLAEEKEGSEKEEEKELEKIAIFGEWCGKGIQKGVAISELPRTFVIFAVRVVYEGDKEDQERWLDVSAIPGLKDEEARVFNIMQFPTFKVEIDFNNEENVEEVKKKMDELTLSVEEECPVGRYFGLKGTGEGVVWQASGCPNMTEKLEKWANSRYWFKTKGVKHTQWRAPGTDDKVKAKHVDPKRQGKIDKLVEAVVTQGRLEQGLQVLEREMMLPLEISSIGAFIKWIHGDVIKEEYDRIEAAGVKTKALQGPMNFMAKKWYIERIEEMRLEKETLDKMQNLELKDNVVVGI